MRASAPPPAPIGGNERRSAPCTPAGAARLQALIEGAAELFLTTGYDAVSLDELISRVGGSRRNIYTHFGGKEGLFAEAITDLAHRLAQPLRELEIDYCDTRRALTIFARALLDAALDDRALALHRLMIAESQRFPHLAQTIWRAGYGDVAQIVCDWIESRQARGEMREDIDSETLAEQFINMAAAGPQIRRLIGLLPGPLDDVALESLSVEAVRIFLDGAVKEASGSERLPARLD